MNISVDATIIVQAVNFFIAYLLFRFILLKPAYRIILEEQQDKDSLEKLVADDKRQVEKKRQEQQDQWVTSSRYFQKQIPKPINEAMFFRGIAPQVVDRVLTEKEIADAQQRVAQAIISAVGLYDDIR